MSLSFSGPKGWIEQRWIIYALLRDNVQHHLEGGSPTDDFTCLHVLDSALGGTRVRVSAKRLHEEIARVAPIRDRSTAELAISSRTRAILAIAQPPERGDTMLVKDWGHPVPMINPSSATLDDVFGHLADGLLRITEGASERDVVEVIDL